MKIKLYTDPKREGPKLHGVTGIYVRAQGKDGNIGAFDLAELNAESLTAWLKRDGGNNLLAENCIRILLRHPQLSEEDNS